MSKIKQVIVWRKDLKVRTGKMMAQACHASMKVFFDLDVSEDRENMFIPVTSDISDWVHGKFTKIVVGCQDENELIDCYKKAQDSGLLASLIRDEGLTEFKGIPTITCIAIGPGKAEDIDKITGHLSLM